VADLRARVRAFLDDELAGGGFVPRCDAWLTGFDPAFSRRLAAQGWVGMTMPVEFGGVGVAASERFVVIEELLAAGAPVAAHWFAERQIGPALVRHGTPDQQRQWIPRITAAEAFFAVGLSEPDAGSDLAAVRTRATRADGGWLLRGTKLWSSGAHQAHAIVVLARSSRGERRTDGLSQFIVPLPDPAVLIRPIRSISGEHHFNEVVFSDAFVADDMVLGEVGNGWSQVISELAFERSGPERFLSTMPLLTEFCRRARDLRDDAAVVEDVGALLTDLVTLRQMSADVAAELQGASPPIAKAALVKDLGTQFEQDSVHLARRAAALLPRAEDRLFHRLLDDALLQAPNFTLRGGTSEILRGIVTRERKRA
jgi:alkylation response protein AidB-like acyl-CoA dehydrogenase